MKKKLTQLADALLSKEQISDVKGGYRPGGGTPGPPPGGGGCSCLCNQVGNQTYCTGGLPRCTYC
ncbi:hypothetical protein [Spirosoma montaniterrae]|uniref:hypothetical protein n=1 Tax=Spirosoma montaniterrae TaxID=1178516 RepID=UPI0012FC9953|nr:hypothetical protein [Spirosoma montaniterrae]